MPPSLENHVNGRILISGASVAGPALAYWLARFGFEPTVVERAPSIRDGGYAVDFRGAAMGVLGGMGVLDAVVREQTRIRTVSLVDRHNRRLADMPDGLTTGQVEIMRGDLNRILYDATRHDTEYAFGDSIESMTQRDNGVDVTFRSGAAQTFDLVIGADGLHSNVRALAFGNETNYISHLGCYVCIFATGNAFGLEREGAIYSEPGRVASLYSGRDPKAATAAFYFISPPLDYDRHDAAAQQRIVAERFRGMEWKVPSLLNAMRDARGFYFDSISQIKMPRWSNGRVALVGDAGYCSSPLSGMGTGMATVGSYILAGELAEAGGDFRAAFERYESRMRSYVDGCQKLADGASGWFIPDSKFKGRLMVAAYRLLPYTPWAGLMTSIPMKCANAIELKDYARLAPAIAKQRNAGAVTSS